ncbi:MAG: hypothetical protein ACYTG0_20805 [Planctomycetota bacterium]|jgi:hypothetical protein
MATKKKRRITWGVALATLVMLAIFLVVWIFYPAGSRTITVSKETTYLLGPLNADGTVDYVAALNERFGRGVTPENNAAVPLIRAIGPDVFPDDSGRVARKVLRELGMEPFSENDPHFVTWHECAHEMSLESDDPQAVLDSSREEVPPSIGASPWLAEEHPRWVRWLERNARALDLVEEASWRPKLFVPLVPASTPPQLDDAYSTLHHSSVVGEARHALVCRAMLRVGCGDIEKASQDAMILHRLGRLLAQDPSTLSWIFGSVVDEFGSLVDSAIATSGKLDADHARRMLAERDQLPGWPSVRSRTNSWNRLVALDVAARIIRGEFEGGFGEDVSLRHVNADLTLRRINYWSDVTAAAFKSASYAQRCVALESFDSQIIADIVQWAPRDTLLGRLNFALKSPPRKSHETSMLAANSLVVWLISGTRTMAECSARVSARNNLARAALALAAHRADKGGYPKSLSGSSPEYLSEVPNDPFTGGPLSYRQEGAGYVLYSVGVDMTDDGGCADVDESNELKDIVVQAE